MARAVRSARQNDVSILVYFGENDKFEFIGGRRSQHQAAEDVQTGKGRMPHVLTKYEIYGLFFDFHQWVTFGNYVE
jgi:hypothetical protein